MKYAALAIRINRTDSVPHISFVFDSFPLICLKVISDPSKTHVVPLSINKGKLKGKGK